jgi:hypothetical protein
MSDAEAVAGSAWSAHDIDEVLRSMAVAALLAGALLAAWLLLSHTGVMEEL